MEKEKNKGLLGYSMQEGEYRKTYHFGFVTISLNDNLLY